MLLFTEYGKVYWMRVFEIPEGSKTSKGRAIQNLINIDREDSVKAFINIKDLTDQEFLKNNFIVMATKKGVIKKTSVEAYSRPRQNGIFAITVREGDELLEAKLTNGSNDIMIAIRSGRAIRFPESKVRAMGRTAAGVRGINMDEKDEVIGMIAVAGEESNILVVSENGYGKRSSIEDYRITNRGGKGVKTINVTDKTGKLIALKDVTDEDDLMIINRSGIVIRMSIDQLRVMGRATQGVRLIKVGDKDYIAAVAKVRKMEEEVSDEDVYDEEGNLIPKTTELEGDESAVNTDETASESTEETTEESDSKE